MYSCGTSASGGGGGGTVFSGGQGTNARHKLGSGGVGGFRCGGNGGDIGERRPTTAVRVAAVVALVVLTANDCWFFCSCIRKVAMVNSVAVAVAVREMAEMAASAVAVVALVLCRFSLHNSRLEGTAALEGAVELRTMTVVWLVPPRAKVAISAAEPTTSTVAAVGR